MFSELMGYDWTFAFQCCGNETDEQRKRWGYRYKDALPCNKPSVNVVLGSDVSSAEFTRDDVKLLIACDAGDRDGPDWIALMLLKDGRFAFLSAGCDYTGWDCRSWGNAFVAESLERLWQYGVDEKARARLADKFENAVVPRNP